MSSTRNASAVQISSDSEASEKLFQLICTLCENDQQGLPRNTLRCVFYGYDIKGNLTRYRPLPGHMPVLPTLLHGMSGSEVVLPKKAVLTKPLKTIQIYSMAIKSFSRIYKTKTREHWQRVMLTIMPGVEMLKSMVLA